MDNNEDDNASSDSTADQTGINCDDQITDFCIHKMSDGNNDNKGNNNGDAAHRLDSHSKTGEEQQWHDGILFCC